MAKNFYVNYTMPKQYDINMDCNTKISITFGSELDLSSLYNNFAVLYDKGNNYINSDSLLQSSLYPVVSGSVSYNDKTIYFTPSSPLKPNSRYIVCINKNIKDALGNVLGTDYIYSFFTSLDLTLEPCNFISPLQGSKFNNNFPTIRWANENSKIYILQISRNNDFSSLVADIPLTNEYADMCNYTPNLNVEEGTYYLRIKALTGEWSDILEIYIEHVEKEPITDSDATDNDIFDTFDKVQDETQVLEQYPNNLDMQVSASTNKIYIKVKGKINIDDIDLDNSYIEGKLYDNGDSDMQTADGILNTSVSAIYDENNDITYIVFTVQNNVKIQIN